LTITAQLQGDSYAIFAVGPDGDGLIWDSQAATPRRSPRSATPAPVAWFSMTPGVVNGTPVVDSTGLCWFRRGACRSAQHRLADHQYVNYARRRQPTGELVLVTQSFEFFTRKTRRRGHQPRHAHHLHRDPIQA